MREGFDAVSLVRRYDHDTDLDDVTRIWREIRWIDGEREAEGLELFLRDIDGYVAEIDGTVECFVGRLPGRIAHDRYDLTLSVVAAVTTSPIARHRGLASMMTARLLSDAARDGAAVAGLGMFEQGFYDRLGFGTSAYTFKFHLDPATLRVPVPDRALVRLGDEHAGEIHALLTRAQRLHGGVVVDSASNTASELQRPAQSFMFGTRDDDGELNGVIVGEPEGSSGAAINLLVGLTPEHTLDLLGHLRAMSDQWVSVSLAEPPGIQLQDLVDVPIRQAMHRRAGNKPTHDARAWWQLRMLDVQACVAAMSWAAAPVRIGLRLTDPLETHDLDWAGVGGDWVLDLGDTCSAARGPIDGLPVLAGHVGPISRWWFGVRPASVLARSTDLHASDDLLATLDRGVRLPAPNPGRYF